MLASVILTLSWVARGLENFTTSGLSPAGRAMFLIMLRSKFGMTLSPAEEYASRTKVSELVGSCWTMKN